MTTWRLVTTRPPAPRPSVPRPSELTTKPADCEASVTCFPSSTVGARWCSGVGATTEEECEQYFVEISGDKPYRKCAWVAKDDGGHKCSNKGEKFDAWPDCAGEEPAGEEETECYSAVTDYGHDWCYQKRGN